MGLVQVPVGLCQMAITLLLLMVQAQVVVRVHPPNFSPILLVAVQLYKDEVLLIEEPVKKVLKES